MSEERICVNTCWVGVVKASICINRAYMYIPLSNVTITITSDNTFKLRDPKTPPYIKLLYMIVGIPKEKNRYRIGRLKTCQTSSPHYRRPYTKSFGNALAACGSRKPVVIDISLSAKVGRSVSAMPTSDLTPSSRISIAAPSLLPS